MRIFSGKRMAFFVLAALFLYSALIFYFESGHILGVMESFPLIYIIPFLILTLIYFAIGFTVWHYFSRKSRLRVSAADNFLVFVSGLSAAVAPAKSGEILRCYILKEKFDVALTVSLPIQIVTKFVEFLAVLLLSVLSVVVLLGGEGILVSLITVLMLIIIFFLIQGIIVNKKVASFFFSIISHLPLARGYTDKLQESHSNLRRLLTARDIAIAVPVYIVMWLCEAVILKFIMSGLNADLSLLKSLGVVVLASTIGALSLVPGGLAVTEGSMLGLLMIAGLPASVSAAGMIILRLATFWWGIILGLISLLLLTQLKRFK